MTWSCITIYIRNNIRITTINRIVGKHNVIIKCCFITLEFNRFKQTIMFNKVFHLFSHTTKMSKSINFIINCKVKCKSRCLISNIITKITNTRNIMLSSMHILFTRFIRNCCTWMFTSRNTIR